MVFEDSTDPVERVQWLPPFPDLEMEGRAHGRAGVADLADRLTGRYILADRNQDLGGVRVQRIEASTVVDNSTLAVPLEPVDVLHPALGDDRDRGPEAGRDVHPAVEGLGPEPGVHLAPEPPRHPSVDGPREPAPIPREVPEEEGRLALPPAREAPPLQLPDQGLDALARAFQLL